MDTVRADVLGSMLRPQNLLDARSSWEQSRLPTKELKRLEDQAVNEVVALQETVGVDVVTDGEMRRAVFTGTLTEGVDGIGAVPSAKFNWRVDDDPTQTIEFENPVCVTGRLRRRHSLATEEYAYARARTDKPVKVTLSSPMMLVNFWHPEHSRAAYANIFEAFEDGAEVIREEIRDLVAMGCPYIQIDAPEVAVLVDERQHDFYRSQGAIPEQVLSEGIDLLNTLPVDGGDTVFGFHMCRGNGYGMWLAEGGYEAIAKQVFPRASRYDRFLLEYDSPRAGSLDAIAHVPEDKVVVLGLISTKRGALEPLPTLLERIDQAAAVFPREQLAVSTQCGFASGAAGNPVTTEDQRRKLELVVEVARRAWPD
jgi:5-methyltetrahydropteroyltriglutamate--homocysteine methyltransferase